jgi:hypothetical protein
MENNNAEMIKASPFDNSRFRGNDNTPAQAGVRTGLFSPLGDALRQNQQRRNEKLLNSATVHFRVVASCFSWLPLIPNLAVTKMLTLAHSSQMT